MTRPRPFARRVASSAAACALVAALGVTAIQPTRAAMPAGAVYAMTGEAPANAVVAFTRAADGALTPLGRYPTGGAGTGGLAVPALSGQPTADPLSSANALRLSDDHHLLFAVNAGNATLTSFRVNADYSLTRVAVVPVGNPLPVSIGVSRHLIYVATDGDPVHMRPAALVGFRVSRDGHLMAIHGARYTLDHPSKAQPAQVLFDPRGTHLIVTNLTTNTIDVFPVGGGGRLGQQVDSPSSGAGPFGARFLSDGHLLVSEAQNGAIPSGKGKASVSSYTLASNGTLTTVSASVGDGRTAACWLSVTPDERYVYASNTADGTISSYNVESTSGQLTLLQGTAHLEPAMGAPTSGPVDSAISVDGRYLYQLYSGLGRVGAYRIEANGQLTPLTSANGMSLPHLGSEGLVAI